MSPLTPALESEGSVKRRRMGNLPSSLMFSDSEMKQYSNQMEEYVSQFRLIYHELFHLSKCKKSCSVFLHCYIEYSRIVIADGLNHFSSIAKHVIHILVM